MTWFRVDDKFHGHRKVLHLFDGPCPADAIALWTLAGSWCGDHLTDGAVPTSFVARSGLDKRAAAELVRVGLWERQEEGYHFKDWLVLNPSKEEVIANREKRSEAGKLGGRRSADARANGNQMPKHVLEQVLKRQIEASLPVASVHDEAKPNPVPSRPVPSPENSHTHAREESNSQAEKIPIETVSRKTAPNPGWLGAACERVSQQIREVTGCAWDSVAHANKGLSAIAQKPAAEWEAVLRGIAADPWAKRHPSRVSPQHIVERWPAYLQPDPVQTEDVADPEAVRLAKRRQQILAEERRIAAQLAAEEREAAAARAPDPDEDLRAHLAERGQLDVSALVESVGRRIPA